MKVPLIKILKKLMLSQKVILWYNFLRVNLGFIMSVLNLVFSLPENSRLTIHMNTFCYVY